MRFVIFLPVFFLMLSGCGGQSAGPDDTRPEASADRARPGDGSLSTAPSALQEAPRTDAQASLQPVQPVVAAPVYWGIREGDPLPLVWEDLMPVGGGEALEAEHLAFYDMLNQRYGRDASEAFRPDMIEEGSELDYMPQLGSFETVPELEGLLVRIPGYTVPLDMDPDRKHTAFLFAPYMGACIHTPPPPPNQLIYVEADPPVTIADMYAPFWVQGVLRASREDTDLASAAYTLRLERIDPYIQR